MNTEHRTTGVTSDVKTLPRLVGDSAMMAWNPTWKKHRLPRWAKARIRAVALLDGSWDTIAGLTRLSWGNVLPSSLFDHWGSVGRLEPKILVSAPYGNHAAEAAEWAGKHQCILLSFTPALWNFGTTLYAFIPEEFFHVF